MKINSSTELQPKEFVCGAGAALFNISVTFPINKIMFRQQLNNLKARKAIKQLKSEGVLNLYRGLTLPLMQKTTSMSIMFGMYHYTNNYLHRTTTWNPLIQQALAAMFAGCLEAFLCPFERIQVLMLDKQYHGHFRNTWHAARELSGHGMREYYRGLSCILLRNGPSNAMFFLARKPLKDALPHSDSPFINTFEDFVSGAVLGATISTIIFPINVIKTRMQSHMGGEFHGIMATFTTVWMERDYKLKKLFRGVHINFSRSLLSWGIINATYEILWRWINGNA